MVERVTRNPNATLHFWYDALKTELGIRIEVVPTDKDALTKLLYEARQDAADPELEKLILTRPGDHPNELWLCHKSVELD